ncbi:hypothetical protein C6A85_000000112835, partial [Mycobacterium sp. ITM-2017-0098]
VRRRFPFLAAGEHNDVTKFTYGFIGFVYAFFVGFVVSSMWSQINTADGNARTEGAVSVQMAMDLEVFDQADRDRVRQSLLDYTNAAITEWNQDLGYSAEAQNALGKLRTAYQEVRATTETQKAHLSTSNSNLDKLSQARTVRLLAAREDSGPPWALWAVILLTSSMVLGTVIIYGVEKPAMHYPMVAVVGLVVASNLFLIIELSHPYIGDLATSPDPLNAAVWMLGRS